MVSGPDKRTSSIWPGSQQGQTPAPPGLGLALLPFLLFALVDLLIVLAKGTPSGTTGGLPLGRAAKVSGKQAVASWP